VRNSDIGLVWAIFPDGASLYPGYGLRSGWSHSQVSLGFISGFEVWNIIPDAASLYPDCRFTVFLTFYMCSINRG